MITTGVGTVKKPFLMGTEGSRAVWKTGIRIAGGF
jgi:hypothetical protein